MTEQKTLLGGLHGSSASVAQIGENLVRDIFANLNLGNWTDTRGETSAGDALSGWTANGGGILRCIIEIKKVKSLHAVKDLQRFWSDIDTNMKTDKMNAGFVVEFVGEHSTSTSRP